MAETTFRLTAPAGSSASLSVLARRGGDLDSPSRAMVVLASLSLREPAENSTKRTWALACGCPSSESQRPGRTTEEQMARAGRPQSSPTGHRIEFKNGRLHVPDDPTIPFIEGALTTPVGGGIRSLNVALRQILDLFACVRPVRYFKGTPSPVKHPEKMDVVIFRENTEDVYAGIEWQQGTPEAKKLIAFLTQEMGATIRPDSGIGIKPISVTGTKRLVRMAMQYALARKRKSVTLVHKGNIMK